MSTTPGAPLPFPAVLVPRATDPFFFCRVFRAIFDCSTPFKSRCYSDRGTPVGRSASVGRPQQRAKADRHRQRGNWQEARPSLSLLAARQPHGRPPARPGALFRAASPKPGRSRPSLRPRWGVVRRVRLTLRRLPRAISVSPCQISRLRNPVRVPPGRPCLRIGLVWAEDNLGGKWAILGFSGRGPLTQLRRGCSI